MLWLQTVPAFCLWVGFVIWRRHWMLSMPAKLDAYGRATRFGIMVLSLFGSLGLLYGGLALMSSFALIADGRLTGIGFAWVTLLGLVFVVMQMIAFSATLSLARISVTPKSSDLSNPRQNTLSNGDPQ